MSDMHPARFAGILATLAPRLPISDQFDTAYPQRRGAWWTDQREHMVSWFNSQDTLGAGAYTRRTPNRSARTAYERLQAPGALLWIAEAIGAPSEAVRAAADAAVQVTDNRSRCRAIRAHLPWARISEAAARHM